MDDTDSGSEEIFFEVEEERTADEYTSDDEILRVEGPEQYEPEYTEYIENADIEATLSFQLIEAATLDSSIHIYTIEEMRNIGTTEWWGLPIRFTGFLLPAAVSLVVHAICLAFTLKVAVVPAPLIEFLRVVQDARFALYLKRTSLMLFMHPRRMNLPFLSDF